MTDAGFVPADSPPPDLPRPTRPPRTGPLSTSLDTSQQVHIGPSSEHDPDTALWRALASRAERHAVKLDYADVVAEISRRADARGEYDRFRWFDSAAGRLRDCATVRVVHHKGTNHGVASPLSCHVRGCPDCERARVGELIARHDAAAAEADRPVFVTLTSRNVALDELDAGRRAQVRAFGKLRRRALFRGGRCRHRWQGRGPTGEVDGSPFHPCHPPIAAAACHGPVCAPGCPRAKGARYAEHVATCDRGCPTRTGLRQSHCRTHPPAILHPGACPRSCPHAGHRHDRNCPTFAHEAVRGGLASFDVTWNDQASEPWNLHQHMLLDAPWVSWAELRDLWQAVTCPRPGCRHQRRADGSPDSSCQGAWMVWIMRVADDPEARHGAIREVLKYVAKPHGIVDSLDPDRVEEYLWALRGQRVVSGWGRWYRIQVAEDELGGADVHRIPQIFGVILVPKVCPVCGVLTVLEDWDPWPSRHGRLEAELIGGRYAWRPPPPTEGRPDAYLN